jgi:multidrug efflux pump
MGDYASRNVLPELQRLPGVGQAQLFGTERAMRIWIDPAKLQGYNLSPPTSTPPSRAERAGVGRLDRRPALAAGQTMSATVVVPGQLPPSSSSATSCCAPTRRLHRAPEGRGAHRAGRAKLRHRRAPERQARRRHGRAAVAQRQRAGHRQAVRSAWTSCKYFPGVSWTIPYDTSDFVDLDRKVVRRCSRPWCWCSW